ncbi:MAG: TonB-dependent receptor, partial [Pyrinomonadaceae bacterium]
AEDRNSGAQGRTPEEAGTFSLTGSPAYSNNITIDGLDNNDDRAARERFQPSLEAVQEVQVITNQFSAEYGRASGGRINIRTRGGSNSFRGRAFYFFRDESLNANTFNNNLRGLSRLPLQQHNPGFTFSGPLVLPRFLRPFDYDGRGRTFFFAAYEYDTVLDSALVDTLVPVAQNSSFLLPAPTTLTGQRTEVASAPSVATTLAPFIESVSTPLRNNIFTLRLDHKFSDDHNGSALYQLGRLNNLRQFGGGLRLAEALQGRTRNTDALAYTDNYVFSPNLVNQLRVQISRLTPAVVAQGGDRPVVLITINDPLSNEDSFDRSGTLVAGSSTTGATDRRETRFQIQDNLTFVRGAHSFKFGGDFQRIRSTFIDLADASGTFNFSTAGDFLLNAPSRFRQNFQTESSLSNTYVGFFAQDEWRVRPNLQISYGLRYENESIIPDRNNFGPRFALAYDPFSTGKTVIRAGAGLFYNRALLRTIDDFTLGQQQLFFDTNNLRDPATGRILTTAQRRAFIAANFTFPQTLNSDSPLVTQFGALNENFSRRLSEDLRIPESYQFNVGFEREINRSFVVEANYTFNRGIHLFREFNANAPVLPAVYDDFAEYLLAHDFANFRDATGTRPLYNVSTAGELVRFTNVGAANPDTVLRTIEQGVPVSVFNLSSFSSNAISAALAALDELRPDPTRGEIEQLASIGNSFYHGLTVEARRRFARLDSGLGFSFRLAYTLSRLIDDGIVNTSDALVPGDFRRERARSLLDRRHRFVFSGTFDTPRTLGALRFSPILRLASGAPFNISIGGVDRNLDDVSNDRPVFTGDLGLLRDRRPGDPIDPALLAAFSLPTIGSTGDLPRNAGLGPGLFLFDLSVTREFRLNERTRLRPVVEINNVLNKTVFTFGAEFINFNALRATATPAQQQAFLDSFLVPTRTLRPRSIRLGLRLDF